MNDDITIIMTTWFPKGTVGEKRLNYAKLTMESWARNIEYDGKLNLHIADDGSDPSNIARLVQRANVFWVRGSVTMSRQERRGVGASLNAGLMMSGKFFAYFVDDWALDGILDLKPWVKLLKSSDYLGVVRLGPPHPGCTGRIKHYEGIWYLELDRHHFAYGHRPALYHKRFTNYFGQFDEMQNALECERLYNERFCKDLGGPEVVYALPYPFVHVADDAHVSEVIPDGSVDSIIADVQSS